MNLNFPSDISFRQADLSLAQEICDLINLAYRGEQGWTNESAIIQGDRTSPLEIESAIAKPNSVFFVAYHLQQLIASIYISQCEKDMAFLGFFSVHPAFQERGIGKHMLDQAESFAIDQLQVTKMTMFVISQRIELIAYYLRRGYHLAGKAESYPVSLGFPKVSKLTINHLEKNLSS